MALEIRECVREVQRQWRKLRYQHDYETGASVQEGYKQTIWKIPLILLWYYINSYEY
jgi:hypothetical protein